MTDPAAATKAGKPSSQDGEDTAKVDKPTPTELETVLRARIVDLLSPSTASNRFGLPREASVDLAVAEAVPTTLTNLLDLVADAGGGGLARKVAGAVGRSFRPDVVKLVTEVFPPLDEERGVGVSLSLLGRRNKVIDSVVIWEGDFCTPVTSPPDAPDPALAIAAAAWVQFHLAGLRRNDSRAYRRAFGTPSWRSFAHFQVGVAAQRIGAAGAERAYAEALENDPWNLWALFNASVVDIRQNQDEQATSRLHKVVSAVERSDRKSDELSEKIVVKNDWAGCLRPIPEACRHFFTDPLWYQAHYQLAAASFHSWMQPNDAERPADAAQEAFAEAHEHALRLVLVTMCAVTALEDRFTGKRANALRSFLLQDVEGQALVLLADVIARAPERKDGERDPECDAGKSERERLICRLGKLTPGKASDALEKGLDEDIVRYVRRKTSLTGNRVYYNLACYYSGRAEEAASKTDDTRCEELMDEAVACLEYAFESPALRQWGRLDPSLRFVIKNGGERLRKLDPELAPNPLRELHAIGVLAAKLEPKGITDAKSLLEKTEPPSRRDEIARDLGVDSATVRRWQGLARLLQIGVPPVMVNVLEGVGITGLGDLARQNESGLLRLLRDRTTAEPKFGDPPEPTDIREWIRKATEATSD